MGHPEAEFKEMLESRIASVRALKKTDGFPVHLISEVNNGFVEIGLCLDGEEETCPMKFG